MTGRGTPVSTMSVPRSTSPAADRAEPDRDHRHRTSTRRARQRRSERHGTKTTGAASQRLVRRSGPVRRPRRRPAGVLHCLAALLALVQRPPAPEHSGTAQRRQGQRLALAQRLLDPLPSALVSPAASRERFWRVLRWGGLGLLVARLLQP